MNKIFFLARQGGIFVHGITRKMKIYLNGEFVEKEDAKVSVFDHGLLYGDGVFEGFVCMMDVFTNSTNI